MLYIKRQSDHKTKKKLFGLKVPLSKKRWYNQICNFKNYKENSTEILKYIQKLKNDNIDYKTDWEIIQHDDKAKNPQSICSTCILEKVAIAKADRRDNLDNSQKLFIPCT